MDKNGDGVLDGADFGEAPAAPEDGGKMEGGSEEGGMEGEGGAPKAAAPASGGKTT
jgi:hypothetical protein